MSTYERTVAAAVAETKSKLRLAEALALDIPARKRGPKDEADVLKRLAEAREAVLAAGGEERSVATLDKYRRTALWVSAEFGRNFAWLEGTSFSAHSEARQTGLSFKQFARLKPENRTVDALRRRAGNAGTRGAEQVVASWTPQQKAAAARELLADPEVRLDPKVQEEAEEVAKEAEHERWKDVKPLPPLDPQSEAGAYTWDYLGLVSAGMVSGVTGFLRELQKVKTPLPDKLREDVLEDVAEARNALDFVETAVTGVVDWDAGLDKLLNEDR